MNRTSTKRRAKLGDYEVARRAVFDRALGACEARAAADCDKVGDQAHHVVTRGRGGTDEPENLLWVCSNCHGFIHANPTISSEAGWLRSNERKT